MEIFGIQFAPLNVPLERRIQTLAAATWMVAMAFGGFIGLLIALYLIAFTKYWWLTLLYLLWIYVIDKDVSEQGGRPNKWVRSWRWWKYARDYFPLRFERLPWVELDPEKNYLFCCFPHGMLSTGAFNAFGSEWGGYKHYFPHHAPHVVTLSQHYIMPFFRELALALGGIGSSAKSIDYVLGIPGGGHVCVLMVGGAAEAYNCKPGNYKLVLEKRKGFVKLALKNGTPLVPVLSFGETDLFDQLEGLRLRNLQESLRKWIGLAPVVPIGRGFFQYSFGIIPRRSKVTTVVGLPIEVPKIEDPTREQVDQYHAEFVKRLTQMFDEQKYNYLEKPEDKRLVIE
ncbi:2-acylglycerol O-acyltransferase 2-like [Anoplophora glabripennis]|uniref:2-acylglycerol O-acyltransferase 2-like n=1 Tax=Anoplophora glabripennis TaxID=217634 RepID=UPI0008751B1F|nr:2-acylglycerol O-acyltransferase 2-like [Anoplophora glabripennis]